MKAMRPVVLVLIAVIAAVIGWLATATTNRFSMPTPVLPVSALITMGVIAGLTLIMGIRVLRWRNGKKKNMLNPILAARTLILAQACAYAGTLLLGWHAGISLDLLRVGGLRSGEGILWNALLMGGGGVVMVIVGLVVERFCRIPPEDFEGGTAGRNPAAAKLRAKANMHTEAIDPPGVQWLRVSPKYVTVRLVEWAIGNLLMLAVLSLPLIFVQLGWWRWPPLWLAITVPAVMLVLALWRLVLIPRQVRAIGYAERDDDLLIRRGIFFQRTMVVPYGRMQYVDVAVGPVERSLGLCTLKLHTASAGTNAHLPGLPAQEGARLREQLSARGEARLAGL